VFGHLHIFQVILIILAIRQIFFATLFKESAFNYHQRNVSSRFHDKVSVLKFEPGLSLGGYDLDYITGVSILEVLLAEKRHNFLQVNAKRDVN